MIQITYSRVVGTFAVWKTKEDGPSFLLASGPIRPAGEPELVRPRPRKPSLTLVQSASNA